MKRALRVICILLLTVFVLMGNTVFSAAETESVDMAEILIVSDDKHASYVGRLTDRAYGSYISYESGEAVSAYCSSGIGYAYIAWEELPSKVTLTWVDKDRKTVSSENRSPLVLDEYVPAPGEGLCGFTLTFKSDCAAESLQRRAGDKLCAV